MSDSDSGRGGGSAAKRLKHKKVANLVKALRGYGVTQFACSEFQVTFECPHGKQDEDMAQIGFKIEGDEDDGDDE